MLKPSFSLIMIMMLNLLLGGSSVSAEESSHDFLMDNPLKKSSDFQGKISMDPATFLESGEGQFFIHVTKKVYARLVHIVPKRALPLKGGNDSLEHLVKGLQGLLAGDSKRNISRHFDRAEKAYPKNAFTSFFKGVFALVQSDKKEAHRQLEQFLLESQTYGNFEELFLRWGEFHQIRQNVFDYLRTQGISFQGREREIQMHIPFEEFFSYVWDPNHEDWILNVTMVGIIVIGGLLLILLGFFDVDLGRAWFSSFVVFYVVTWMAYVIWIFDVAFGFPWEWPRALVIQRSLIGLAAFLFLCECYGFFKEQTRPVEEGYKKCSHCHKPIIALAVECEFCRKKVN